MASVLLCPSPLLPPSVLEPLADALRGAGPRVRVAVPPEAPSGPDPVLRYLRGAVSEVRADLVVMHSNAGRYPALAAPGVPVVHVDAALPREDGEPATLAPEAVLGRLEAMADEDGWLPPWSRWWAEDDVARVLPDPAVRDALRAEEFRMPLSYFRSRLGAPVGWAERPQAYLAFGDTYAEEVALARRHGWPVEVLREAGHLHLLVDPHAVAAAVIRLAASLPRGSDSRGMLPS